jgi:hypothetical protein
VRFNKPQNEEEMQYLLCEVEKLARKGDIEVKQKLVTDKQFRALHLWFRQCETELNAKNIPYYRPLSGKPSRWREGDFKAGVFKPFIKHYKGMHSTKELNTKDPSEFLEALTAHIAGEHGVLLPQFPSLESLRINSML